MYRGEFPGGNYSQDPDRALWQTGLKVHELKSFSLIHKLQVTAVAATQESFGEQL